MTSFGPVDRLTAGAVGTPGDRTFYIEIEVDGRAYSFLAEKQQVAALAHRCLELVRTLREGGPPADPAAAAPVREPEEVVFRVGEIAIAHAPGDDQVRVTLRSVEEDDAPIDFLATVDQLQAMSLTAVASVSAGRPLCPRCNLPMDLDGHVCPASNGDLRSSRP